MAIPSLVKDRETARSAMQKEKKKKEEISEYKTFFSFFSSLILHLIIFLVLFFLGGKLFFSEDNNLINKDKPKKNPEKKPPTLIFKLAPPSKTPTSITHPLLQTQPSLLESDHESQAASQEDPTGTTPVPSQGDPHRQELVNHLLPQITNPGIDEENATDLQEISKPTPQPTPHQKIEEKESIQKAKKSSTIEATPSPTASSHPIMGHLSTHAGENDQDGIPIIRGNISNKGTNSLAAQSTPLGKYKEALIKTIQSHWSAYVDAHVDLLSMGSATISCYITSSGEVKQLHVVSNSSNETLVEFSLKSILDTPLPKMPPELAKSLKKGQIKMEYIFTIYPDMSQSNDDLN